MTQPADYNMKPTLISSPTTGACSYTAVRQQTSGRTSAALASVAAALVAAALSQIHAGRAAVALVVACVVWLISRRLRVSEESLTAIEGVGLQLCTRCVSGRETSQFIEAAAISAIFVTEAVRFDCCYFYLACLLRGDERDQPRLVVPFRHLIPRLEDLQRVCRGAQAAVLLPGAGG